MIEVHAVQFSPSAVSALRSLFIALEYIGKKKKKHQRAQVSIMEKANGEKQ